MKKDFCVYIGECYCMAKGIKSWLWACGKGILSIFSDRVDFLGL